MALPNLGAHDNATDMGTTLQREIRSNSRDWLLDESQNASVDVDVSAGGTIVLTTNQQLGAGFIRLTGSPGAGFTIELADGDRFLEFENVSGQTATIDTNTGAASPPTIADGDTKTIHERGIEITVIASSNVPSNALLVGGSVPVTGDFVWGDFVISRAKFKDIALVLTTPSSSAGTLVLNMTLSNVFEVTLTEAVTTLTLSAPPASGKYGAMIFIAKQDGTGTWAITFPGSVKWEQDTGSSPSQTTDANAVDVYLLITTDAGTTWYGFVLGLDMR